MLRQIHGGWTFAVAGLFLAMNSLAPGQTDEPIESSSKTRLAAMQRAVGRIAMKPADGEGTALELRAEPVFRWNNPQSRVSDGAVFVWLSDNRPAVLGAIHLKDGAAVLELQSLSENPLIAKLERKAIWAPDQPGIEWIEIANAPAPAATKAEQLRQIKHLATEFSVSAIKTPPDYQEGSVWHFRLLPRPLFEYGDDSNRGAIFAFSQGTDPEAYLLIERRKNRGGSSRWHAAYAAGCVWELHGRHLEREIWSRTKNPNLLDSSYTVIQRFPIQIDSVPDAK